MQNLQKDTKINQKKTEAYFVRQSAGFSLVEVIIAVSIATFSILAVWRVYTFFIELSLSNPALFQASFLAEEGIEAVKFMRDDGWTEKIAPLSSDISYHLAFDGSGWEATTTPILIDNRFYRLVNFANVYRDSSGNIVDSGSPDANTKKISVTVSWQKNTGTTTKEIITYVSNIFQN